ncbi:MAG: hypothetical protein L3K17_03450 [Thermoplasmata archaeon]|nr:hypothetical protein [Thermoplasmata archaeon]
MKRAGPGGRIVCLVLVPVLVVLLGVPSGVAAMPAPHAASPARPLTSAPSPVSNFTAAINRIVTLLGLSGGGLLAVVWARVALSWFSNDVTKKIQAKDRARDALIGTLLFTAALSGLIWGLAHWVLTGT